MRCQSERVVGDGGHGGAKAAEGEGCSFRENQERI
jgi:hypothetical protein